MAIVHFVGVVFVQLHWRFVCFVLICVGLFGFEVFPNLLPVDFSKGGREALAVGQPTTFFGFRECFAPLQCILDRDNFNFVCDCVYSG